MHLLKNDSHIVTKQINGIMGSKKKRSGKKKRDCIHAHIHVHVQVHTYTHKDKSGNRNKYLLRENSLMFSLNQIPTSSH